MAIAIACGLAYFAAILRRRRDWALDVRRVNVALSIGICALALLLALPILSFGAISAGNQVWRIRTGRVAPEKADWAALAFDFGPAGPRAIERLAARAPDAQSRMLAGRILQAKNRYAAAQVTGQARDRLLPRVVDVLPRPAPVPKAISDLLFRGNLADNGLCSETGHCLLEWRPGDRIAIGMLDSCGKDPRHPRAKIWPYCGLQTRVMEQTAQGWGEVQGAEAANEVFAADTPRQRKEAEAVRAAALAGEVELRTIQVRQVFVDGKPEGSTLR